jgi:aminoglycoside phosphotransferase family enzyme
MRADCRIDALIGDRAYKGKKPITTNFLDFSSPDSRERACAREVELNRRLAPDSYLGVVHLSDPSSRPDEPVVVMRREREGFAPRPGMLLAQRGGNHIVRTSVAAIAPCMRISGRGASRSSPATSSRPVRSLGNSELWPYNRTASAP